MPVFARSQPAADVHGRSVIEVDVRDVSQLFNSLDPSPFPEKDLDDDAEEFIVSWAREFPRHAELSLVVHLSGPVGPEVQAMVEHGIHSFFAYRAELIRREFHQLMRRGRASLLIGLAFVAVCILIRQVLMTIGPWAWPEIVAESVLILGWVAMWRPLEIFLYDWWPLARLLRIYRKLSTMRIEVRQRKA
jgi:hypothetical protein